MAEATIVDGIIIGAVGGGCAGITVWLVQLAHTKIRECRHKKRVYDWLCSNTSQNSGNRYRSTRAIAGWTNLTEDRVRYVCSIHKNIYPSTGPNGGRWSVHDHGDRSVYEERGLLDIGAPEGQKFEQIFSNIGGLERHITFPSRWIRFV